MSIRGLIVCALIFLLGANGVSAARYQRCKDGKTLVWNSLRGVAQEAEWSGARDLNGYATGEGTLTWYRLAGVVNTYTGKMQRGKFEGPVVKEQAGTRLQATFANGEKVSGWSEPRDEKETAPSPSPKKRIAKVEEAAEREESDAGIVSPTPRPTRSPRPTVSPTATPRSIPSLTPSPMESPVPSVTPTPQQTSTPTATSAPVRTPTPTPTPIATAPPIRTPTPTATPSPVLTPTPTSTPSPIRTPIATPIPATPIPLPTAISAASVPQLKSEPPGARSPGGLRLDQGLAPTRDSLDLALPPPRGKSVLPPAPWTEPQSLPSPSATAQDRPLPSATPGPSIAMDTLAGSKSEMIAEFKKQTAGVLGQAKKA
ncbi:MAG TPA: hypothetical protein VFA58_09500, partial [Chthoniobacterales bacterium]|nr:hypothetical protein [Chthoniobacterales bacterium]